MKIVLFIGVLIASVLGQAENRCAVSQGGLYDTELYVFNQSTDSNEGVPVADFNEAIIVMNKFKSVGACSPLTAGCLIGSDRSGTISYHLKNKVLIYSKNGNYFSFRTAFSASKLDDVILAFDQLVKAGGCQP